MALRLRPSIVTAGFVVLLAVIANLAWATALTTAGPWFGTSVNLAVYSAALALPSVFALVLVHQAAARVAQLDASLVRLDRRIALLRAAGRTKAAAPAAPHDPDPDPDFAAVVDGGSAPLVRIEKAGHDTLVSVPRDARAGTQAARMQLARQLVRERIAIREARTRVWSTAAGPVAASLAFLAVGGPMLPGSDAFAAAHYVLNTTCVLFLSYGFAPLAAWTLMALGMIGSVPRRSPS